MKILKTLGATLLSGFMAVSIPASEKTNNTPAEKQKTESATKVSGLIRTAIENGQDTLPNLIVNIKSPDFKLSSAFDIYDPDGKDGPKDYQSRLFWLNVSKDTQIGKLEAGMFSPFFNNPFLKTLYEGAPLISLDKNLTLNGGITGINYTNTIKLPKNIALTYQAYGGTKIAALNRDFGDEKGSGYGSLVYGGGASVEKDNLTLGYRFTRFGEGDAEISRNLHNIFGSYRVTIEQLNDTELLLYGEKAWNTFKARTGKKTSDNTTLFAQAITPWTKHISTRLGFGQINDENIGEAHIILKAFKNGTLQIGQSHNFKTNEKITGSSFTLKF